MNSPNTEKKEQRWTKYVSQQAAFKRYNRKPEITTASTQNENITATNEGRFLSLLSMIFCGIFTCSPKISNTKNDQDMEKQQQSPTIVNAEPAAGENKDGHHAMSTSEHHPPRLNQQELGKKSSCSSMKSMTSRQDIVPLRQFFRYSMALSDQRAFQRRHITQPFQPKYEIEWQKNQWLQLDDTTNNQIEQLRKNGFSKIAIRKDNSLKKHIAYDNPSDIDVLLELSLYHGTEGKNETGNEQPEPIVCHQPTQFSVRRIRWWQTTYQIGEAHLPSWVDTDLCCNSVMMNARSVLATVTNYSHTSFTSFLQTPQTSRFFDSTPSLSEKPPSNQLRASTSTYSIKPLQYSDPPFLMEKPVVAKA